MVHTCVLLWIVLLPHLPTALHPCGLGLCSLTLPPQKRGLVKKDHEQVALTHGVLECEAQND